MKWKIKEKRRFKILTRFPIQSRRTHVHHAVTGNYSKTKRNFIIFAVVQFMEFWKLKFINFHWTVATKSLGAIVSLSYPQPNSFLLPVAGDALSMLCGSKIILQVGDIDKRSPLAKVNVLLSSRTELRFSIQILSTGPSKTSHMCSPVNEVYRKTGFSGGTKD